MIVSKLKANPNKNIARLGSEIVAKWKKSVQTQQQAAQKKPKMAASSPTQATASSVPGADAKGFTGDKSKRKWETEGVDTKRTGTPTRDACVGLLYNGLAFMSEESSTRLIIKAWKLRRQLSNSSRATTQNTERSSDPSSKI